MRRTIIIGTAIAMLVGASAAFASFNTYSAGFKFSPTKAGTSSKPVTVGFLQTLGAGGTSGNRAAPLTDLKTTIYGIKANGKLFVMISSRGQFVVKLPRMRAQELVRLGKGKPFDPGHGRLMKEWVSLDSFESSWPELAKEAYEYVRQGVRRAPTPRGTRGSSPFRSRGRGA